MNRTSFLRWTACLALAALGAAVSLAAETDATPAGSLSASKAVRRAAWQEHFTLGPGDVLNLSLFEAPETARTDVPIGPDGKIAAHQFGFNESALGGILSKVGLSAANPAPK